MTWGQLRFQLQAGAPGVSLDLIDGYLNTRYEQVLEATDWQGLKKHATVQTVAAYLSGADTVTLTVGSASVIGDATAWTQQGMDGLKFYRPGDSAIYTATYVSATELTLDRPYEGLAEDPQGTVYAASTYVFMQNVYTLPPDCVTLVSILDPISGRPMPKFSKDGLDQSAGMRTQVADPRSYALYDDTAEDSDPTLHQVEFFPPPRFSRGHVIEYTFSALGFDGENTSGSPLPWISSTVLLKGCRADIATHLEKPVQAAKYEAEFERELSRLLLVEFTQRRKKTVIQMAGRFTRHRVTRVVRGLRTGWGPGQGGPN